MDPTTRHLIESLHNAPYQYVMALTGGGTQAAAMLLNVPGGSRTVLNVVVPYSQRAFVEFLGREPEQYCSVGASRELARRAWEHAGRLAPGRQVAGVGCSASLASDRPKKGDHRFHLSVQTAHDCKTWSLTLAKGSRDREGEEAVLDLVFLNALAETFGLAERLPLSLLPDETIEMETYPAEDALARLHRGEVSTVCAEIDGRLTSEAARPTLLLPGSFNPLHEGHLRMAEVAARLKQTSAVYELSIENVDKATISIEEVRQRLRQFIGKAAVWITRAPTFVQKTPLFPGATFVVGYDTAQRLLDPEYHGKSEEQMLQALETISVCRCSFMVAGRVNQQGQFLSREDLKVSEKYAHLFEGIPERDFRVDVASRHLRAKT